MNHDGWYDRSYADDAHRDDRQLAEPAPGPDVSLADVTDDTGYCPVCLNALEDCIAPDDPHNRVRPAGVSVQEYRRWQV